MSATHETVQIRLDGIPDHCRLRGGFSGDYGRGGAMREPKKVRTTTELIKSCRMLREHNEKLKAELETAKSAYSDLLVNSVREVRELEAKLARSDRKEIEAVYRRLGELEAKLKWLEGLLRINQICNCCGDHLSEGACVNLDCGRYGANQ